MVLLLGVTALAIRWGSVDLSTRWFFDLITGQAAASTEAAILREIRLPRVLLAILAPCGMIGFVGFLRRLRLLGACGS